MKQILGFILVVLLFSSCSQPTLEPEETYVELIPSPKSITYHHDVTFKLSATTELKSSKGLEEEKAYLQGLVNNWLFETETIAKGISNVIALELIEGAESELDWHSIAVDDQSILIKAHTKSGIAKGIQTLRQLMPAESFSDHRKEWNIKSVQIEDFADFEHRGMLLDCCRHYFEKDVVFKYIDLLALYKMNVLHWHLTEDQGWRVEIDSYPMLNTIASSRTELDGSVYSGIYSKEDMKAVVAYAKERGITVIPEIELPGHSQAAIAAYPHLSCTGEQ
ncbi:MAG: family 20 glycosylhydrolase, partial [Flavobacteriales bacterium]